MKIDCDTCVFRGPLSRHRIWLLLAGLSLSPELFGDGEAVAQLKINPDTAAAVSLAKQASQALPDRSAAQEKNAQREGIHGELIKKALGDAAEEEKGSDKAAKASRQAPTPQSEMIDQINALRRQMGGGVADQLDGLFDDSEQGREQLQREFNRELNKLVAKPLPAEVVAPVPGDSRKDAANPMCVALRNAARELDSVAADLEDAELYQTADRIRASAVNLRSQARKKVFNRTASARQPGRAVSNWMPSPSSLDAPAESPRTRSGLPANALDPKIRPRQ